MICSAEDLFILNSNKFRMVYKVDGNPQFDSRDWSMYSNILNFVSYIQLPSVLIREFNSKTFLSG